VDHDTRAIVLKYMSFHIYLEQKNMGNFSLQSPFNRVFCVNSMYRQARIHPVAYLGGAVVRPPPPLA
jgi:hypothetical protein